MSANLTIPRPPQGTQNSNEQNTHWVICWIDNSGLRGCIEAVDFETVQDAAEAACALSAKRQDRTYWAERLSREERRL